MKNRCKICGTLCRYENGHMIHLQPEKVRHTLKEHRKANNKNNDLSDK